MNYTEVLNLKVSRAFELINSFARRSELESAIIDFSTKKDERRGAVNEDFHLQEQLEISKLIENDEILKKLYG